MLTQQEIQDALGASRTVPLGIQRVDGPLGLEQLAETVVRLVQVRASQPGESLIERPIALSNATWQKLDEIARKTARTTSQPTSASAVAAALLDQCVAGV